MKITIEGRGPFAGRRASFDLREPAMPENEPPGSVLAWARAKGHVPGPHGQFRGYFHRGPNVRVVARHMRWPLNKVVSEADYDEAVVAAYAVRLGEDLAAQDAALAAANARAVVTDAIADDGEEVTA